jgi:hypothetical protein
MSVSRAIVTSNSQTWSSRPQAVHCFTEPRRVHRRRFDSTHTPRAAVIDSRGI